MDQRKLRDVWHETQTVREYLEQTLENVKGVERAILLAQQAEAFSDGVENVLAIMRKSIDQMRSRVREVDNLLAATAKALVVHSERIERMRANGNMRGN